jgi:pyridoxine 4-dehydrogenase
VNRALLARAQALLGVPIDVYLPARIVPSADPVAYFAPFDALRKEGHFTALGASEVQASTLASLSTVYTIAVAEIEISLWSWEQSIRDVVAWSTRTHTPVYAYSPLGRGFLTRTWKTPEDIPAGSFQAHSPRFQGENFYHNLALVDALDAIAARRGMSTAQLAIAWVCATGPYVSMSMRRRVGELRKQPRLARLNSIEPH